jgi:integrase
LVAKHLSFDAARLPTPGRASHISLHDLRHTAATLAVAAGESVLFVSSMLGHSDARTMMRYAPSEPRSPSRSGRSRGGVQEKRHQKRHHWPSQSHLRS